MMEQEAEALGTVGFLSTCLFPKPTHCPPACTTRPPREAPPEAPQPRFDRAATWGFSSCSHFYPLLTDEETGSEPGPGLSKACGGLEEAGCKPRLGVQTPSRRPPQSPSSQSPRPLQPPTPTHPVSPQKEPSSTGHGGSHTPLFSGFCGYPGWYLPVATGGHAGWRRDSWWPTAPPGTARGGFSERTILEVKPEVTAEGRVCSATWWRHGTPVTPGPGPVNYPSTLRVQQTFSEQLLSARH